MKRQPHMVLVWAAVALIYAAGICQGDGAMPSAPIRPASPDPDPYTNYFFFAATCIDDRGLESDYSNEVCLATTNALPLRVTLAWDPSPSTNVITNYTIYQGVASYTYTQKVNVGTARTGVVHILPRFWNHIVRVSCTNCPGITLTNPQGKLFMRAWAWRAANGYWPTVLQVAVLPTGPWHNLSGIQTNLTRPTLWMKIERWIE